MQKGQGGLLAIDCGSGIAGDMMVAALLDLGVPFSVVENAVGALDVSAFRIRHEHEMRNHIKVSRFMVEVDQTVQPHRHFSDIEALINKAPIDDGVKKLSLAIFEQLARAEARVHGVSVGDVHFHEVGAVDSIVDIVGAAAALDFLQARVVCGPVPVGSGTVETQHGMMPLPAPATMELLKGVPMVRTGIGAELTTPTGAAIIRAVSSSFEPVVVTPSAVGMGAGSRQIEGLPGFLRLVLGREVASGVTEEWLVVLEANIDDMSGELAANGVAGLLSAGALDAWCEPIVMKKGRPAFKLCALGHVADRQRLTSLILEETTTIGVRSYGVDRTALERKILKVKTRYGEVPVKVAGQGHVSPEFDACLSLARTAGVPVKIVMNAALAAAIADGEGN